MKTRVNKKTATIKFESPEEIKAFADMVNHYMEVSYEDGEHDNSHGLLACDRVALKLDKKFNKDNHE